MTDGNKCVCEWRRRRRRRQRLVRRRRHGGHNGMRGWRSNGHHRQGHWHRTDAAGSFSARTRERHARMRGVAFMAGCCSGWRFVGGPMWVIHIMEQKRYSSVVSYTQ